jgi:GNAT superfamily N-acetyltransferase
MIRTWDDRAVLKEILPPETGLVFTAMRQLRTNLISHATFVDLIDTVQRPSGYRLVAVVPDDGTDALAVAGFRLGNSLSWGRHIYIDDLFTVPSARRNGFASQMLAWIHDEAERLGCSQVHLDSGVGPERYAAHRFYLDSGYNITAHHLMRHF